jgi:hypothetical protein
MIVNTRVNLKRVRYFFEQSSSKIYWPSDLANIVREHWVEWNIPNALTTKKFIQEYLLEKLPLRAVKFESDSYPDVFRYVWKESATELELALSLKRSSYFSHATAVWLHQLSRTNAYTKKLYVNHEQRPKQKPDSELSQDAIDNAFGAPQRQSKYAFTVGTINCVVLNGKHSGRLGVSQIVAPTGECVDVTDPERTLVDIAVRPTYSGGVATVLEVYGSARKRVSVEKLVVTLKELDYIYPYHQAVGFYLERAGYSHSDQRLLADLGNRLNFYLEHGLDNPAFDTKWRVFYPRSLA